MRAACDVVNGENYCWRVKANCLGTGAGPLRVGSVPHPSEVAPPEAHSAALFSSAQHTALKVLAYKNALIFLNSLHCQYYTSPSNQVKTFARVGLGLIVLDATMKSMYFMIISLSNSPPCLILYRSKNYTALRKDTYLPAKSTIQLQHTCFLIPLFNSSILQQRITFTLRVMTQT